MEITGPPWVVQLLKEGKPFVDMLSGALRPDDAGYPRAPGTTLTYTLDTLTGWTDSQYVVVLLPASGTISVAASGATINGASETLAFNRTSNPSGVIVIVRLSGANAYGVVSWGPGDASGVTVENVLTSTSVENALSAAQGKALKDAADALAETVSGKASLGMVQITANVTVNAANAAAYNGQTLVWSGAWTVTLSAGLPPGFGFAGRPPASGNASVAVAGGVTIDGAGTTITRALASNKLFAVQGIGTDTYTATGA